MIFFLKTTAIISFITLSYIYVGYPLILLLLTKILKTKEVDKKDITPRVTLFISCYNEEKVIKQKILNSLTLTYPKDKIEIIVISDCSNDRTDEIAHRYTDKGITLLKQEEHLGKTAGLNNAVKIAQGEILVFSDANAMYAPDAISKLVRNFNDKSVGFVVGKAQYLKKKQQTMASKTESTYWQYEITLKKMESKIHSVVGGDGAIYAIRKDLYDPLSPEDINDFVNPLQIIKKGYRGIYEDEAVCTEDAAGTFQKEFLRKIRIVNRSFSGLLKEISIINPFLTGIFSFKIFSHKILRWFAPFFIFFLIAPTTILSFYHFTFFKIVNIVIILIIWCAYAGYLLIPRYDVWPVFYYPYYFCLVNLSSAIGVLRTLRGYTQTTWETPRQSKPIQGFSPNLKIGIYLTVFSSMYLFFLEINTLFNTRFSFDKFLFWIMVCLIVYVYFGYPIILFFLSIFFKKPYEKKEITPSVTLLICAYNEEMIIEEKIKNSLALNYPKDKLKIFIASDGSIDKTSAIIRKYSTEPNIILFDFPDRSGKIGAIKKLFPHVKSSIVVFSDANTMYHIDSIRKLVRNFKSPSVGAVSSDVILHSNNKSFGNSESIYYRYERWIQKRESQFESLIGADGGMYAIRTELFVPPSSNIILDDFVISMNVTLKGYRLVYDEEAVGYEQNVLSSKEEFLRKSRVVAGAIQSIIQKEGVPTIEQNRLFFCYISHKMLRWLIPVFLIILFVANSQIIFNRNLYLASFICQVIFYLLAATGCFLSNINHTVILSLPYYFCMVNCAALFGIYKGFFNKQPVKWQTFNRKG